MRSVAALSALRALAAPASARTAVPISARTVDAHPCLHNDDAALEDIAAGRAGRCAVAWYKLSDVPGSPRLTDVDSSRSLHVPLVGGAS